MGDNSVSNEAKHLNDDPVADISKNNVEYIIESPIRCGFLLAFCESEYNAENMKFLIEVVRFRDTLKLDKSSWSMGWKEVDSRLGSKISDVGEEKDEVPNEWPSRKINRDAACGIMQEIVDNYISFDAPHEICISRECRERTLNRVKFIDYYGPEVFNEATLDPIKTLKKDILPRFVQSDHYFKMINRIESCDPLPSALDLEISPPDNNLIDDHDLDEFPDDRRFEFKDFLHCGVLYEEFLTYLRKSLSSENLICLRMIEYFEELMEMEDYEEGEEVMWEIYRYFIAYGSAYEISLRHSHKKILMRTLAIPKLHMFDEVKNSVLDMLKRNFSEYKDTPEYAMLSSLLRKQKMQLMRQATSKFSCFGK